MTDDTLQMIQSGRHALTSRWTEARTRAAIVSVQRRLRTRRRIRLVCGAGLPLLAALATLWISGRTPDRPDRVRRAQTTFPVCERIEQHGDRDVANVSAGNPVVADPPPADSVTAVPDRRPPAARSSTTLLELADAERAAGNPRAAADRLRELIRDQPRSRHAATAAFSLGRLLVEQLDRPAEAAVEFARAATTGGDSLAEDALAREVQAWRLAGQDDRARQRAETYLARFPGGYRAEWVKQQAGLE